MLWVQSVAFLVLASVPFSFTPVLAQSQDSWPRVYPGMPSGDYSPEWQNYFEVTSSLPNVSWPLARNWAGNIPVQRSGHPNNTLFFWAFESSNGSLTANNSEPWAIWLNGGPGDPSLDGLLLENGPINILGDYSAAENPHAWSTVTDYVWIDQPVGTGFSTVDPDGCIADEDQMGADFMGFLENFTKVFPNLASRPLYLSGESYAGRYIPYITKVYFQMENPPVNLSKIVIGDGAIASLETTTQVPVVTVLETYPQIIGYDTEVFEYFQEQSALCGYDLTLQYPQPEHFPSVHLPVLPTRPANAGLTKRNLVRNVQDSVVERLRRRQFDIASLGRGERLRARNAWKRDLAGRGNGTIDPWYGCDLYTEMIDYAVNFTFPWSSGNEFDLFDVPDALSPEVPVDASVFLNDPRTRAAIHAPTSKEFVYVTSLVFLPTNATTNVVHDPSVEPMAFLTDLATNMTAHDIKVVIYSGNDDSLVPHFGSQIAIQNTTFGGIQGFTRKPQTPWYNDAGEFGGIVHQERGWTYALLHNAGHLAARTNPISALTFIREFVFGDNQTGLVTTTTTDSDACEEVVVGGEDSLFEGEILPGQPAIYYGEATTASSYFFPTATVQAWNAYIATATATAVHTAGLPKASS